MRISTRILVGLCLALSASAAVAQVERCVRSVAEFNSAWLIADDEPVLIKMAVGNYDLSNSVVAEINGPFRAVDDDVVIRGGYNSNCSALSGAPADTRITSTVSLFFRNYSSIAEGGGSLRMERLYYQGVPRIRLQTEDSGTPDENIVLSRVWFDQVGSVELSAAEVDIDNLLVTRGGNCAVYVDDARAVPLLDRMSIRNSTITGSAGVGLCVGPDDRDSNDWSLTLTNNVFWDNLDGDILLRNTGVNQIRARLFNNTYLSLQSDRGLASAPVGTSSANPQFVNPGGLNWRLSGASPAINSGRIDINLLNDRDFDGNPRWFGQAPDRGAFESNVGSTATVLTVTNSNDAGIGSLRQALIDANAAPNVNEIHFNIAGACPRTITLASLLPDIVQPVLINGYSQPGSVRNTASPGWNANLCIVLNGANQITGAYGFNINTGASPDATVSIEGIAFSGHSIAAAQFIAGRDHRFVGNQIGGVVGSTLLPSATGVRIGGTVEGVHVGGPAPADRNVIANTLGIGINLSGSGSIQPSAAVIENNYIGTQSGGDVRGNQRGLFIASPDHLIRGNVITNASSHGVELSGTLATGNRITDNRIGVPALCIGTCANRGNSGHGVFLRDNAHDNRIESNQIAYSGLDGIALTRAQRNSLRRNTMFDQNGIGIDLGDDGRDLFDANNSEPAPINAGNDGQNAARLSSVAGTPATGLAAGSLTSANGWYRIDFYGIPETTGCTLVSIASIPVGFFGDGRDWLGSTFLQISNGTSGMDGSAGFSDVELNREGSDNYFTAGSTWITATATRLSGPPLIGAYRHLGTSEFGRCRQYTVGDLNDTIFIDGFED